MASAEKPPFEYCKIKATAFGKEWAREEYGRGFTQAFIYGKRLGAGKTAKQLSAKWDDGAVSDAQISKCEAATAAEFKDACKATKDRAAGEPCFPSVCTCHWSVCWSVCCTST